MTPTKLVGIKYRVTITRDGVTLLGFWFIGTTIGGVQFGMHRIARYMRSRQEQSDTGQYTSRGDLQGLQYRSVWLHRCYLLGSFLQADSKIARFGSRILSAPAVFVFVQDM